MSTLTTSLASVRQHLRPFDVRRDLDAVASLVETCFADTLDEDGQRYVRQMHNAARNPGSLSWVAAMADHASIPVSGYIWEEDGIVVGNLSLIPFLSQGRQTYLIANVAVDAKFRKRGIARALTEAALQHAHKRRVPEVWLHVRVENQAAIRLYTSLGFREQARRSTWELDLRKNPGHAPSLPIARRAGIRVTSGGVRPAYWPQYSLWLTALYPAELSWHIPLNLRAMRGGLQGSIYRLIFGVRLEQWVAWDGSRFAGVLTWQPHAGHADHLCLASDPEHEEVVIPPLLAALRSRARSRHRMILDYPAGRGDQALQDSGLKLLQTLIWMKVNLK